MGRRITKHRPIYLCGDGAEAWLYLTFTQRTPMTAITVGHVIIAKPERLAGREGQVILAHELAHTRQHDWLGPLYLPAHAASEIVSLILTLLLDRSNRRKFHAYNVLEQTYICLGASACLGLARGELEPPFDLDAFMGFLGASRSAVEGALQGGQLVPSHQPIR